MADLLSSIPGIGVGDNSPVTGTTKQNLDTGHNTLGPANIGSPTFQIGPVKPPIPWTIIGIFALVGLYLWKKVK